MPHLDVRLEEAQCSQPVRSLFTPALPSWLLGDGHGLVMYSLIGGLQICWLTNRWVWSCEQGCTQHLVQPVQATVITGYLRANGFDVYTVVLCVRC